MNGVEPLKKNNFNLSKGKWKKETPFIIYPACFHIFLLLRIVVTQTFSSELVLKHLNFEAQNMIL